MTEITKKIITKSLRFLLLALSLGYIIYFFIKNKNTLEIAFSIDAKILVLIALLQVLYFVLQSWRFQLVMEKCSGSKLPFWGWLRIFILGRFLNLLFSQLGNVYRGIRLKKDYSISYTRYVSGFTSMAWIDTCMNLLIAVFVIIAIEPGLRIGNYTAWKILLFLFLTFLLTPIILEAVFNRLPVTHPKLAWGHNKLSEVLNVTVNNLRDFPFLCKIIGLGIILFLRTILTFHLYFLVFETPVSLPVLTIFYALFKLSFFVILTPGNLGVQEIAWGFISDQVGVGMGQGILISGFIRVVSSLAIIILGIGFGGIDLIRHRKQLQHIQTEELNTSSSGPENLPH